ncbi:MAG TPA: hypothetical protein VF796_25560 [Humisphaera sp.]
MAGRPSIAACVVSLVPVVALAALWLRSFRYADSARVGGENLSEHYVVSLRGRFCFGTMTVPPETVAALPPGLRSTTAGGLRLGAGPAPPDALPGSSLTDFRRLETVAPDGRSFAERHVPHWVFVIPTAVVPALVLRRRARSVPARDAAAGPGAR